VTEEVWGKIRPLFDQKSRKMVVKAVDSKGSVIASVKVIPPMPSNQFHLSGTGNANFIFPWLNLGVPGGLGGDDVRAWPGTPDHKIAVPLDISPDAQITTVHISME